MNNATLIGNEIPDTHSSVIVSNFVINLSAEFTQSLRSYWPEDRTIDSGPSTRKTLFSKNPRLYPIVNDGEPDPLSP